MVASVARVPAREPSRSLAAERNPASSARLSHLQRYAQSVGRPNDDTDKDKDALELESTADRQQGGSDEAVDARHEGPGQLAGPLPDSPLHKTFPQATLEHLEHFASVVSR